MSLRLRTSLTLVIVLAALGLSLSACTPLAPYRTHENAIANCAPQRIQDNAQSDDFASVDPACDDLVEEISPATSPTHRGYTLDFVEFDDQGRLFPATNENGLASEQMRRFLSIVREGTMVETAQPVSVVVFVHGWKHNALSSDSNVRWFRAMLDRLAAVEARSACPRRVVGLYVGWRGDATTLPDLAKNATFWTRKKAASRVADGQIRELLARLRAIQDIRNADWNGLVETSRRNPDDPSARAGDLACAKRMRLTIVGHSFGGLIVYNALAPSLIRDMADLNERIRDAKDAVVDPVLAREGDLIITVNPAVEAAAFAPLWFAARAANPSTYHAPVFVSITSADDDATGMAFPAARFFNTLLNKYPNGANDESSAARQTIGHDQDLVDYRLLQVSVLNKAGHVPTLITDPECEKLRTTTTFSDRFAAELKRLDEFVTALQSHPDANGLEHYVPRQFCIHAKTKEDDAALALDPNPGVNLNSPVWNVYTAAPVLNSHSDLLNPLLIDVLRQLYEEGTRAEAQRIE